MNKLPASTCRFKEAWRIGAGAIALIGLLAATCGRVAVAQGPPAPPGPNDLVVFIAKNKPNLYRLNGAVPQPFGSAKFHYPCSIVADQHARCVYVLDRPAYVHEDIKIWRIEADGRAAVVFRGKQLGNGGPFAVPAGLGLDAQRRLLVADPGSGLWRIEKDGSARKLIDAKRPFLRLTAATAGPNGGILFACGYVHEVTGGHVLNLPQRGAPFRDWYASVGQYDVFLFRNSTGNTTGRQVPIREWKSQGGLFFADPSTTPPRVAHLLVNRRPGDAEWNTYWHSARQMLIDSAGRIVLVDMGVEKTEKERTDTSTPRPRNIKVNGGVMVIHPDGRMEHLLFKGPPEKPCRVTMPCGVAEWADGVYLVAAPDLYVEGQTAGSGGLMLLGIDGSRDPRWPFGWRIKPVGVAILRQVGSGGTPAPPLKPLTLEQLAGVRHPGPITKVQNLSWKKLTASPHPPSSPLSGLGRTWVTQPQDQATAYLKAIYEGARWEFAPDGSLVFSARGVDQRQQGHLLVQQGRVTTNNNLAVAEASYRRQGMFDSKVGSVHAMMQHGKPGEVKMSVKITVFADEEQLQAEFEQTMVIGTVQ